MRPVSLLSVFSLMGLWLQLPTLIQAQTLMPTEAPTDAPTDAPTGAPTKSPTIPPTAMPTTTPIPGNLTALSCNQQGLLIFIGLGLDARGTNTNLYYTSYTNGPPIDGSIVPNYAGLLSINATAAVSGVSCSSIGVNQYVFIMFSYATTYSSSVATNALAKSTYAPTRLPTLRPSALPTQRPTGPSPLPTAAPTGPTFAPTLAPPGDLTDIISVSGVSFGSAVGLEGSDLAWLGAAVSSYAVYFFNTCPSNGDSLEISFPPDFTTPVSVSETLIVTNYPVLEFTFGKCYVVCPPYAQLTIYSNVQCTKGVIFATVSPSKVPTLAPTQLTPAPTTGPTKSPTYNPTMHRPPVLMEAQESSEPKQAFLFSPPVVKTVAVVAVFGAAGMACLFFNKVNRDKKAALCENQPLAEKLIPQVA